MVAELGAVASVEQIAVIVAAVLAQTGGRADAAQGRQQRRVLDERQFRRLDKFAGQESAWRDRSFQLRAGIRGASKETLEAMNWVERVPTDHTEEEIETQHVDFAECAQIAGELYDLLCSITTGEALTLVRTMVGMNGLVTWIGCGVPEGIRRYRVGNATCVGA